MILRRRKIRTRNRRVPIRPRKIRFDELKQEAQDMTNIVHFLRRDLESEGSILNVSAPVRSEELH